MDLLLLSNSTNHGSTPWAHAREAARPLVEDRTVLFLPYALADHDGYTAAIAAAFDPIGARIVGIHTESDPIDAVLRADAVYVGGGNTWRLLRTVQQLGLITPLRERAVHGMPYLGASAGTNIACPTIQTTNDMPIVKPNSFEALALVDFQINAHYMDPDRENRHMGETRETRINEFHEENPTPVLGLREGSWLRVEGASMELVGAPARLFRKGEPPIEVDTGELAPIS